MVAELTGFAPDAVPAPADVAPVRPARARSAGRGRRQSPVLRIRTELPMRWRVGLALGGLAGGGRPWGGGGGRPPGGGGRAVPPPPPGGATPARGSRPR